MRHDLLTLALFIAVVEEQSIAAAAEREHIAASAVSRRISELEAMLETDLFTRPSKGFMFTEAGVALLHHARTIQGAVAVMRGLIRVSADSIVLRYLRTIRSGLCCIRRSRARYGRAGARLGSGVPMVQTPVADVQLVCFESGAAWLLGAS